ncbi:hypothetical protein M9H77_26897 [Catharanthus roseus]|uniref:Uncharacterized protein n=1 Tax=Catharanthus roseus TaxID=4058 RepID=A0ACC0ABC8_CATRO|nr:hypothetical protein M9H77_26897 [Catharanthus roseus]
MRIIKDEINRASKILADPENLCRHWFIELRRAAQNILYPTIPLNPEVRGKSHWEHIQIAHVRVKKSSESGSGSGSRSRSGTSACGRENPPWAPGGQGKGHNRGPSSGLSSLSVHDASGSSEFPYTGAFYNSVFPCIVDWKIIAGDGNCGFRILSYFLYDNENQ